MGRSSATIRLLSSRSATHELSLSYAVVATVEKHANGRIITVVNLPARTAAPGRSESLEVGRTEVERAVRAQLEAGSVVREGVWGA